ncbi:MAG: YfcE family phosphodiesterase [Candidatus Omnitrophica bacterium]|nr:YfcE family phosphodiesterase [Candidatus Omnitrophota bacterium]
MRIALLADVHANLSALKKIVEHARQQHVDEFWNLGDMVGYAPFPNETVLLLKEICSCHIVGNYDRKTISDKRIAQMEETGKDAAKIFSFAWTNKNLSSEVRAFIEGLSFEIHKEIEGHRILLTHGSPEGMEDGITQRTPVARLSVMAEKARADIILCAHMHRFLEKKSGGVLFVNPGSVGRPFDGDPRASYAILEISSDKIKVEPFRLDYSQVDLLREMERQKFPHRLMGTLIEARSLDDLDGSSVSDADKVVKAALELARECRYEKEHAHHVTKLALRLFEEVEPLHGLGLSERILLQSAALLHDIGLVYGEDGHHKASRDIILKTDKLFLTDRERTMVALIARYHRKSFPDAKHKYYKDLSSYDREIVDVLAAILRVADGMDRSHKGLVKDFSVAISLDKIRFNLETEGPAQAECEFAKMKGDLFEHVFGRTLVLQVE